MLWTEFNKKTYNATIAATQTDQQAANKTLLEMWMEQLAGSVLPACRIASMSITVYMHKTAQ